MGDGDYIKRLMDLNATSTESTTGAHITAADIEDLGHRLDAADGAGQKAHDYVDRFEVPGSSPVPTWFSGTFSAFAG
jgi:hypothetical protein